MTGNPHFCPQCGHVGPPKRARLNWFGWLLLAPALLMGAAAGTHLSRLPAAIGPAAQNAVLSLAVTYALISLALLLLILLTRRPVCAACGWRHTRPATPAERAAT